LAVLFGSTFRPYITAVYSCRTFFVQIISGRIFMGHIVRLDFKAVIFGCTFKPYMNAGFFKPCFFDLYSGHVVWLYL
jgi:hypothetical protein